MRHIKLVSTPLDIPEVMRPIFAGVALYNTGTLTVAYKRPVAFRLLVNGSDLMMHPMALDPGKRIEIDIRDLK